MVHGRCTSQKVLESYKFSSERNNIEAFSVTGIVAIVPSPSMEDVPDAAVRHTLDSTHRNQKRHTWKVRHTSHRGRCVSLL
jgi:hypothetical protein